MARRRASESTLFRSTGWLIVLCLLGAPAWSAASDTERFHVEGDLHLVAESSDQRFQLQAEVKRSSTIATADQRFVLHQVQVPAGDCDASGDPLFANGFE